MLFVCLYHFVQCYNDMLPKLSRGHVDRLINELQNAEFKLEFEPTSTIEYVESLNFLEEIQERVSRNYS